MRMLRAEKKEKIKVDQEEIRIPRCDFESFCRYCRFMAVYL